MRLTRAAGGTPGPPSRPVSGDSSRAGLARRLLGPYPMNTTKNHSTDDQNRSPLDSERVELTDDQLDDVSGGACYTKGNVTCCWSGDDFKGCVEA